MIDIAVIGNGPAGMSAAINAYARNKTVEIFGRDYKTTTLYKAEKINNYLGMPNLTGKEMMDTFNDHLEAHNIKVNTGRVQQIMAFGDYFMINCDNELYQAKTVIIATGLNKASTIKNESDFLGKGLSYCATCDGMLYRGKDVVLAGEIEEALEDVKFLSEICNNVTYVCKDEPHEKLGDNVKVIKSKLNEVHGENLINKVVLANGDEIETQGVFVIKESIPFGTLIDGLELEGNGIKINRLCETNLEGVYACGDVTGWPYQVSNAVGEGLIAAQQAAKYLTKKA